MILLPQNQNNPLTGSVNNLGEESGLSFIKREEFEELRFDNFSSNFFGDDSLDEMFTDNPFENISTNPSTHPTESGYCTTTASTPENLSCTVSGINRDSSEISNPINSGHASMCTTPTTPGSTLPSFMEIYSPRSRPGDNSNQTYFKFDQDCCGENITDHVSSSTPSSTIVVSSGHPSTHQHHHNHHHHHHRARFDERNADLIESTNNVSGDHPANRSFTKEEAQSVISFDQSSCMYQQQSTGHQQKIIPEMIPPFMSSSSSSSSSTNVNSNIPALLELSKILCAQSTYHQHITETNQVNTTAAAATTTALNMSPTSYLDYPSDLYQSSPHSQMSSVSAPVTSSSSFCSSPISVDAHRRHSDDFEHRKYADQQCLLSVASNLESKLYASSTISCEQESPLIKPSTSSSQLCAVCGDNAACQHYGVRTCEGCKGFFKRTVQKGSKYVCLGNRDCPVDKRRRNRCQFCRFQKCLAVGMMKEVVRTDSLKGRRGRLPLKPKSPQESATSPPVSTITALIRAYLDSSPDISKLDYSMFQESFDMSENTNKVLVESVLKLLASSIKLLRVYAEKVPGFSELDKKDQNILFLSSCLELFTLRFVYQNKLGANKFIFTNGYVLSRGQLIRYLGEWFASLENFSKSFFTLEIDLSAFACLCGLSLVSVRHGLHNPAKVENLQNKIIESLRDHTTYNCEAQKKPHYFSNILSKLSDLRSMNVNGLDFLNQLIHKEKCSIPSEIEQLFSPELFF